MSLTRNLKPHTNTGAEFPTVPALWYSMVCSHPHSLPHILHDEYMIHTCLATSYNSMSLPSFVRSQGPHGQTHTSQALKRRAWEALTQTHFTHVDGSLPAQVRGQGSGGSAVGGFLGGGPWHRRSQCTSASVSSKDWAGTSTTSLTPTSQLESCSKILRVFRERTHRQSGSTKRIPKRVRVRLAARSVVMPLSEMPLRPLFAYPRLVTFDSRRLS